MCNFNNTMKSVTRTSCPCMHVCSVKRTPQENIFNKKERLEAYNAMADYLNAVTSNVYFIIDGVNTRINKIDDYQEQEQLKFINSCLYAIADTNFYPFLQEVFQVSRGDLFPNLISSDKGGNHE